MNVLHIVWLLSLIGAASFFLTGYFACRIRSNHDDHKHDRASSSDDLNEKYAAIQKENETLTNEVLRISGENERLKEESEKALRAYEEQTREDELWRIKTESLSEELQASKAQLEDMRLEQKRLKETLSKKDQEVKQLVLSQKASRTDLATNHEDGRKEEREEMTAHPAILKGSLSEMEEAGKGLEEELARIRAENAQLKILAEESETLRNQISLLNKEVNTLKEITQDQPSFKDMELSAGPAPVIQKDSSFKAMLEDLAGRRNMHSVVVSDSVGLLIEGIGKRAEEVAAVAAHITVVSNKTMSLLSFEKVQQISLEDVNALTVTIHPMKIENWGDCFVATCSTGPGPDRGTVLTAVNSSTHIAK